MIAYYYYKELQVRHSWAAAGVLQGLSGAHGQDNEVRLDEEPRNRNEELKVEKRL